MNKLKFIVGTALALLCVQQVSFGQIAGTKHDFGAPAVVALWNKYDYTTRTGVGEGSAQICQPCHTPHAASAVPDERPLWSHAMSVAAYTMYSNAPTYQATTDPAPSGKSKMCLSCHDGTVALDNFTGMNTAPYVPGPTMAVAYPASNALLGTDLSNDHPISMVYDPALVALDPGLWDPTTTAAGAPLIGTIDAAMLDINNKVQCTSCHNPHTSTYQRFLIKSNTGSALCLTCHNK